MIPSNDELDFDQDSHDPASANRSAAAVVRHLAACIERANIQARTARVVESLSPEERARRLDFALIHLASVMSETEVIGMVGALRHSADASQEDHTCEFCGAPTQPWSMLIGDPLDDSDLPGSLTPHSWDQYGVALCKSCHFSVRRARGQSSFPM